MTTDANQLRADLAQFYGSETVYRYAMNRNVLYTEGFHHFINNAGGGAHWLLDILGTEPAILKEACDFAVVTFTVADGKGDIHVTDGGKDGNDPKTVFLRRIEFTDCPDGEWKFFYVGLTLMLPSEY